MLKIFNVVKEKEEYDEVSEWDEVIDDTWEITPIWQIAIDILETKSEMILVAPVAWINLEDIDLLFSNSILTIKWERKRPELYYWALTLRNSECFWGEFQRNIILPENLDFDNIKASLENSILLITIPKLKFQSQSIEIKKIEN
jgi:HSP20 family protein